MPSPQSQGVIPPIVEPMRIPIQMDERIGAVPGQSRSPIYDVNSKLTVTTARSVCSPGAIAGAAPARIGW